MELHIFSICGYAKCVKQVFGDNFFGSGLTKKDYDKLLSDVSEGAKRSVGEVTSTVECANDVVLIDGKMLAHVLPSMSGFITIKLIEAFGAEWTQHRKVSDVSPRATKQRSCSAGMVASPFSVAGDLSLPFTELNMGTPSSNDFAPMTPIITCRAKVKCWPGALQCVGDGAKDTDVLKKFREAVVVSVNTMRFLGAVEGSLVQLEYHDEKEVKATNSVVFGLISESVGEELSSDSYLRHFIAPFFLESTRAVSVGEEFELKNYRFGQVHVKVISIDDGKLKCGLVTDATCIRLVVQPAALPSLQGHECSRPFGNSAGRRGRSYSNRRQSCVYESNLLRNTNHSATEISPRPSLFFCVERLASRGVSPNVKGSPRVLGSIQRRPSRSAEPHSIATCLMYTPQTQDSSQIQVLEGENRSNLSNVSRNAGNGGSLNAKTIVSQDTGATVDFYRRLPSAVEGCNGVRAQSVYSLKDKGSSCFLEEVFFEGIQNKKNGMGLENSIACSVDKPIANTMISPLFQNYEKTFCTSLQRDGKQNGHESNNSLREKSHSVRSVLPHTLTSSGVSLHQDELLDTFEIQHDISSHEKLNIAANSEIQSNPLLLEVLGASELSKEKLSCGVTYKSTEVSCGDVADLMSQREEEASAGVCYAEKTTFAQLASDVEAVANSQFGDDEVYTQCGSQRNIHFVPAQNDNSSQDISATGHVFGGFKTNKNEEQELSNVTLQNNEKQIENGSCLASFFMDSHASSTLKKTADHPQHLAHITEKASEIIQRWLEVKARWQNMPISPLLKNKPYSIIKQFQYFIALYKELRQRHLDCLAYLNSPYGHTLRGDMVVRISLIETLKEEVGAVSASDTLQKTNRGHDAFSATGEESEKSFYINNGSITSDLTAKLLKLRLRTISAALGREILHIFRVWGTCPALYCTLMQPYTNCPGEVLLMGKSYRVDVLQWTIMEDLCNAREVSRREWTELSKKWSEAIRSVLQLGVFTEHLKNVQQLLFELSSTLHHVGGVRQSARKQKSLGDSHSLSMGDSLLRDWEKQKYVYLPTGTFDLDQPVLFPLGDITSSFEQQKSFFFYLQELQDTYYLYSELFEPFVVHLKQQIDNIFCVTDTMQCKELATFLQVSYKAQLADEEVKKGENKEDKMKMSLVAAEEERTSFLALVEAHKAGKLMPLPKEWWGKN